MRTLLDLALMLLMVFGAIAGRVLQSVQTEEHLIKIIGGTESAPHAHPYQAGILVDNSVFCGGVLISASYVLTAAHCVTKRYSTINVILGAHNPFSIENTQQIFTNPIVIVHPDYDFSNLRNDIAVLKLKYSVKLTNAVRPIRYLADEDCGHFDGSIGLLTGWGSTSTGGYLSSNLRQAYLEIIGNKLCKGIGYQQWNITKSQICTLGDDALLKNVGACYGDSGGPLVVDDFLVGLVSLGAEECEIGYPTVYTRISYYREWISKHSGV